MGLVIGVSACVGCAYAINKKRKSKKKKRLAQEAEEKLRHDGSGAEDGEYDEQGQEYIEGEVTLQIHSDVISHTSHSESLRKRKRGRSVESENMSKVKPYKETTRRKKLQEEDDKDDVTDKTGSLRSQKSNTSPSKSKKNYRHVELSDSTSEDEGVDLDKSRVYVRCENDGNPYESEEVYPITRNLRLSIRQNDSGNTVFKIYASDKKTDNTNLRNTTDEITV